MRKNLRTVKAGIIFGILLFSLFISFIPTTSAGIIKVPPLINIRYPKPEENLIPNSGALDIPLRTTFALTGPFAGIVQRMPVGSTVVQIELKVIEKEDWIEASIANPIVELEVGHTEPYESTLSITITEQAPAFTQGIVRVRATSKVARGIAFNIEEKSVEYDISFIVGYWPVISYTLPQGNFVEVGPLDVADISIDIENLGNGPTYVGIELINIPKEDWQISIPSSVMLSSAVHGGEGTRDSVQLRIKPPFGFGFHNEVTSFKVRFSPIYIGVAGLAGQTETITFSVQNLGMSPGTYELPLIVSVVVIILLIFYFSRQRIFPLIKK